VEAERRAGGTGAIDVREAPKANQRREELRATLLEAGREILREEGLETGSSNLTFKRVFERVEDEYGVRLTNASVIRRVWANVADYQADVLVAIAHDQGRPEIDATVTALGDLFEGLDLSTEESRARALQEVCRVGGAASSDALGSSTNWSLWISTVAIATATARLEQRRRIQQALKDGFEAVVEFWEGVLGRVMQILGLRLRRPWTIRQFTMAVTAYSEGCSLRRRIDGRAEGMVRATGPNGEDQEWTLFAVGLEALVHQFYEPDPDHHGGIAGPRDSPHGANGHMIGRWRQAAPSSEAGAAEQ
jgi:hypothetical protein